MYMILSTRTNFLWFIYRHMVQTWRPLLFLLWPPSTLPVCAPTTYYSVTIIVPCTIISALFVLSPIIEIRITHCIDHIYVVFRVVKNVSNYYQFEYTLAIVYNIVGHYLTMDSIVRNTNSVGKSMTLTLPQESLESSNDFLKIIDKF